MEIIMDEKLVLYNAKDLKIMFGVGINQAYQLMNVSGFPSIKIGRKFLVEKNSLEKWLQKNQEKKNNLVIILFQSFVRRVLMEMCYTAPAD